MMRSPLEAALVGARIDTDLGVEVAAAYGETRAEYEALRSSAGVTDLSDRGSVLVAGPDSRSFLQSLVSQDLDPLRDGEGAMSLLLEPRGKLGVAFRALRLGEHEWWLDTDPGGGGVLAAGLRRFRVRVKAEIADRSGAYGAVGVFGPEAREVAEGALGVAVPQMVHGHVALPGHEGCRLVAAGLPGIPGAYLAGPVEALGPVWGALRDRALPIGRDAMEIVRIESGVPRHGRELDDSVIAQEAFLEHDAVSFGKGCFLGQELVCRVQMRGHVNRFLRGLLVSGDAVPAAGAPVRVGGAELGHVTSAAQSPRLGVVALGYVRREVEPPSAAEVDTPTGPAAAQVLTLPLG